MHIDSGSSINHNTVSINLDAFCWVNTALNIVFVTIPLLLVHQALLHVLTPFDDTLPKLTSRQIVGEVTPLLHISGLEIDALQVRDGHHNSEIPYHFPTSLKCNADCKISPVSF